MFQTHAWAASVSAHRLARPRTVHLDPSKCCLSTPDAQPQAIAGRRRALDCSMSASSSASGSAISPSASPGSGVKRVKFSAGLPRTTLPCPLPLSASHCCTTSHSTSERSPASPDERRGHRVFVGWKFAHEWGGGAINQRIRPGHAAQRARTKTSQMESNQNESTRINANRIE